LAGRNPAPKGQSPLTRFFKDRLACSGSRNKQGRNPAPKGRRLLT